MSGKKKPTYSVKTIEEIDFTEPNVDAEWLADDTEFLAVASPVADLMESDKTHLVGAKDTWATIATLYCPKGKTVDEYYAEIFLLNGKPQLVKGMILKVA